MTKLRQGRPGRPRRLYETSWGDRIDGLYHCPDGRWRINATGQKFTEHDERRAVQHFMDWKVQNQPEKLVSMPVKVKDLNQPLPAPTVELVMPEDAQITLDASAPSRPFGKMSPPLQIVQKYPIPEAAVWPWLRELLITQPDHVARMVGIPEVAKLRQLPQLAKPLKLADLIEAYRQDNRSKEETKNRVIAKFEEACAGAKTLDDLTTQHLLEFRRKTEAGVPGAGTRKSYYSQIKTLLAFGLKVGLDAVQIRAALDRCGVLWTKERLPPVDPKPISREDFHTLLKAAGDGPWRAWLMLALNLCLHIDETCDLQWPHFDLKRGTYARIRGKTEEDRIPRAATLWPETVAILAAIKRRGESPWVFTSTHGGRYNSKGRVNDFKEFREAAGLPDRVTFDCVRDGAYTEACRGAEEKWARVLAGHRAPGLLDNYVLRVPECSKPACDAVYKAYFG